MVEAITEQLPVRQPGKRIVEGQTVQFGLGRLQLGAVTQAEYHPVYSGHIEHGSIGAFHIPPVAGRIPGSGPG